MAVCDTYPSAVRTACRNPSDASTLAFAAPMTTPDAIVIGSGPAGVSAAWPLLEAGWRIHMLDAGPAGEVAHAAESWTALRHNPHQWRDLLGDDLGGLADRGVH